VGGGGGGGGGVGGGGGWVGWGGGGTAKLARRSCESQETSAYQGWGEKGPKRIKRVGERKRVTDSSNMVWGSGIELTFPIPIMPSERGPSKDFTIQKLWFFKEGGKPEGGSADKKPWSTTVGRTSPRLGRRTSKRSGTIPGKFRTLTTGGSCPTQPCKP